ncbi:LacI family DNA-binding transcriptional regulator [Allostreptomyces psammosilenae]|uniref:LacI family transcriptional regulator n=1 Tax=Allostreptomyces psammosilenae TaxID=1892865 RepID=A0A852ZQS6_9ACTN|nr:LacI family DNA-binding transcriptional regulator [Allostreptomyces psammosilenae]NYI03204.1 LacI family transcriptional regulator [Allostreptomyces psammosilenae]
MTRRVAVTLEDVARRAGVSLSTASRVINGSTRSVTPEFRERVLGAASELGYLPNRHAQAVARGRSSLIGVLVHDIADPYFSSIAAGAMREAEPHGMVVLGNSLRRPEYEPEFVATMRAQRTRALVLVGSRVRDAGRTRALRAEVAAFLAEGGQVCAVGQPGLGAHTVQPANRAGARALAHALADRGYRDFAVLRGPDALLTATERLAGFCEGLAARGLSVPDAAVIPGPFTREGGHAAALALLEAGPLPDCVFAVNDVMALGALAAFREQGIAVPDDVALAGFDDIPTLRDVAPALTTVRLPLTAMGQRAAALALEASAGPPRLVRVDAEVVLRESTRRPVAMAAATPAAHPTGSRRT